MKSVRETLLTAVICITIGGIGGYYYSTSNHHQALTTCEHAAQQSQEQINKICQGYQLGETEFGNVRVSEIVCNGKQQLCFCGTPSGLGL